MEEIKGGKWKWNPLWSSSDMPTQKPFLGVCGINSNVRVCLLEEVRPVNVFSMSRETDFWLHLVVMMPVQHCRMTVLQIRVCRISGLTFTVDELKAFMSLSIMKSRVKNDTLQAYWSTQKSTETPFLPSVMSFERYKLQCEFFTFFGQWCT